MTNSLESPYNVAEQLQIDCLITAKSHYNAESYWLWWHYGMGMTLTVTAAILGTHFMGENSQLRDVAAILTAVLGAIVTFLKPSEKSLRHKTSADAHLALRNEIRTAVSNVTNGLGTSDLERFTRDRNKLLSDSPHVPAFAYKKAQAGIKAGESKYD